MGINDLLDLKDAYAQAKRERNSAGKIISDLRKNFEALPHVQQAAQASLEATMRCGEAEDVLREALRAYYEEHGNLKPVEGLGIRLETKAHLVNPVHALEWARANAPDLLTIDERRILLYHRYVRRLPFVSDEERVTPTISPTI